MTPSEIAKKAREMAVEWIRLRKIENSEDMILESISDKSSPEADIIVDSISSDRIKYYFEVKGTTKDSNYFGATTITECMAAIQNKGRYWFLIVNVTKEMEDAVLCMTLQDMLKYMTIPPFKINFNLSVKKHKVNITEKKIEHLSSVYSKIKLGP